MSHTTKELREIDAFCAEFVMGYRRTENPDDHTTDSSTLFWHRPAGDRREAVLVGRAYVNRAQSEHEGKEMFSHSWSFYEPTTDPAASRELEKKICEKLSETDSILEIGVNLNEDGSKYWFVNHDRSTISFLCAAETPELAIALFARKIFSPKPPIQKT